MMEIFKLEKDKLSLCQNGLFIKCYISIQLLQKGPFFLKTQDFHLNLTHWSTWLSCYIQKALQK